MFGSSSSFGIIFRFGSLLFKAMLLPEFKFEEDFPRSTIAIFSLGFLTGGGFVIVRFLSITFSSPFPLFELNNSYKGGEGLEGREFLFLFFFFDRNDWNCDFGRMKCLPTYKL